MRLRSTGQTRQEVLRMPTPQKPIQDAIVALTIEAADLYGDPFFHWASCELEHLWQAEHLAEELTKLGYEVFVVDDYTVSWEPPPDEYHIGSRLPAGHTQTTEDSQQQPDTDRTSKVRRQRTRIWRGTSVRPSCRSAFP
jgi:hypothetical protein